jgi:hypothetical protein
MLQKDQNCNEKRLRIAVAKILKNSLALDGSLVIFIACSNVG